MAVIDVMTALGLLFLCARGDPWAELLRSRDDECCRWFEFKVVLCGGDCLLGDGRNGKRGRFLPLGA